VKFTVPAPPLAPSLMRSPVPLGLLGCVGPDAEPHQLSAASTVPGVFDSNPYAALPAMSCDQFVRGLAGIHDLASRLDG